MRESEAVSARGVSIVFYGSTVQWHCWVLGDSVGPRLDSKIRMYGSAGGDEADVHA